MGSPGSRRGRIGSKKTPGPGQKTGDLPEIRQFTPRSGVPEQVERGEIRADDRGGRASQPGLEHRGVDAAEVDAVLEVAVVEVVEAGVRADQAGLRDRADDQDRG